MAYPGVNEASQSDIPRLPTLGVLISLLILLSKVLALR
jgi:hypothetical protein